MQDPVVSLTQSRHSYGHSVVPPTSPGLRVSRAMRNCIVVAQHEHTVARLIRGLALIYPNPHTPSNPWTAGTSANTSSGRARPNIGVRNMFKAWVGNSRKRFPLPLQDGREAHVCVLIC